VTALAVTRIATAHLPKHDDNDGIKF